METNMMLELNIDETIPELMWFFEAKLNEKKIANCEIMMMEARINGTNFLIRDLSLRVSAL